jgi:Tfp pilus assembly protein PilF
LRLNPRSFEARIGKGVVLGRQGELDKAEQLLRDALVLNPNPVRVHYELALLYEKRGEFARAIAEYKEGLIKYQEGKR